MSAIILVGDEKGIEEFITGFKEKEKIDDIATSIYSEKILVENSRQLIKSISFKSSQKRLFVLKNEITIEAQNSLLKNLEELEENVFILICSPSLGNLLPTIQSRCAVVNLINEFGGDQFDLSSEISHYLDQKISLWQLVDRIEEKNPVKDLNEVLVGLRKELLIRNDKKIIFDFCKKTLRFSKLVENNNINLRIALERIFAI